jgi:hypothetical protein
MPAATRNGVRTTAAYDGLGRITALSQPGDAPGVPSVKYTYAPHQHNGNPAAVAPGIMQTETLVSPNGACGKLEIPTRPGTGFTFAPDLVERFGLSS